MYQVLRIGKYDSPFGSVMTTAPSVLDAIREQEKREQNDIVYNYRNYVVNKDYSYEIRVMQKYFYIFVYILGIIFFNPVIYFFILISFLKNS